MFRIWSSFSVVASEALKRQACESERETKRKTEKNREGWGERERTRKTERERKDRERQTVGHS